MVRFEKFLNASKELEWEGYYIAYGDLKNVLRDTESFQKLQAKMRASGDFKILGQSQHGNTDTWMLETSGQSLSAAALEDSFSKVITRANRIFSPTACLYVPPSLLPIPPLRLLKPTI